MSYDHSMTKNKPGLGSLGIKLKLEYHVQYATKVITPASKYMEAGVTTFVAHCTVL